MLSVRGLSAGSLRLEGDDPDAASSDAGVALGRHPAGFVGLDGISGGFPSLSA